MSLHFYYAPRTCALATHISLELAGAQYETTKLDFKENQQNSTAYLSINPKGRVPALVTEHGILTETPALLLYLAQRYPEANLAPLSDPFALAQMQSVNNWFCSTVHVNHAHGPRGSRWADDPEAQKSMKAKVAQNMTDYATLIESEVLSGPWVMGNHFTIADPYLFTMTSWMDGDGVDMAEFPKIRDHYQRMLELPAVKKVAPLHGMMSN